MALRPRIDRELAKYLVNGERIIVSVRQHGFSLWKPIAIAVAATFIAIWTDVKTGTSPGGDLLRNSSLLLFWGSIAWLLWKIGNWRRDWFVATDKRFLLFYGFVRRRVAMMPLLKVTDMTFDRSPIARIVGYGTFVMESAGQDQALSRISFVPDAEANYHSICTVLFGPNAPVGVQPRYGGGPAGGSAGGGGPDQGGGPDRPGGPRGREAPEGENPGPAVVVGPRDGGVSISRRGHPSLHDEPESWYRSSNLREPADPDDTGEIPVVPLHREDDGTDEVPLYPPRTWMD